MVSGHTCQAGRLGRRRRSQRLICAGDQRTASFAVTVRASAASRTNRLVFGRRRRRNAWFWAKKGWYRPSVFRLRVISR
jgi:hypothetical protein